MPWPRLRFPSLFILSQAGQDMISVEGDIGNLPLLSDTINRFRPEVVFHMAAQALVGQSYRDPISTYATNIMGTVMVLEAARKCTDIRVVVNVTSDKCYENQEWVWGYRESDALGGFDPYSCSKGCSELITASYRKAFFNPEDYDRHRLGLVSVRAGNVIGGGDWAEERLVPDIMAAFIKKQPVRIRCPNAVRPWQHVLEPLSGYLDLAEKLFLDGRRYAGAWNFGPLESDIQPVRWIVDRVSTLWGGDAQYEMDNGPHPHEAGLLKLDCSKARSLLGWAPRLNLGQALEWTVDWYKAYDHNSLTAVGMIEEQILSYQSLGA